MILLFFMMAPLSWSQTNLPMQKELFSDTQLTSDDNQTLFDDLFSHVIGLFDKDLYEIEFRSTLNWRRQYMKTYSLSYKNLNNELVLLYKLDYDKGEPINQYYNPDICNMATFWESYSDKVNNLTFDGSKMGFVNGDTINFVLSMEAYHLNSKGEIGRAHV